MEIPERRSGHVAVVYKDHIIVWGGYNEEKFMNSQDIWLYHINKFTWKKKLSSGEHPPIASGSCAAVIESSLYLFAGFSRYGDMNSIHTLDLKSFEWCKPVIKSKKPSPRNKLGCWATGDKILFFGGYGERSSQEYIGKGQFVEDESQWPFRIRGWNNDLLLYDTEKNEWKGLPVGDTAPTPRAAHACATASKNVGYIFGGRHMADRLNDLYSIMFDSFMWTKIITDGNKPVGRSWHSLTADYSDLLFLFGGFTTEGEVLGDGWILHAETKKWKEIKPEKWAVKRWHTACRGIYPGQMLIFGGCQSKLYDQEEHLSEVTVFQLSPLPLLRLALDAVVKFKKQTSKSWTDLPDELKFDLMQLTGGG